jgi:metalloendopeptidase OMA1, mitochondrial
MDTTHTLEARPASSFVQRPDPTGRGKSTGRGKLRRAIGACLLGLPVVLTPSCKGLNVFSADDDIRLGVQAYDEVLAGERILTSGPQYEMVQRVTLRLVTAAQELDPQLAETPDDLSARLPWEVRVIDDPNTVNAFCLPGGKMAVYTGILPVAGSDAGLAVVMGHEIAHATLRHGTQRVTQSMGLETAFALLGATTRTDAQTIEFARLVGNLGIGLPFSRRHELEADRVGLKYMAQAGYDPREAVGFWTRMSELSAGGPPEFLSTHPADRRRINEIEALLPEVLEIYERQRR